MKEENVVHTQQNPFRCNICHIHAMQQLINNNNANNDNKYKRFYWIVIESSKN